MKNALLRVLIVIPVLFTAMCSKTKCDDDTACAECRHPELVDNGKSEVCQCTPNTDYKCPESVVNGYYDYDHCVCQCYTGWMGANCDQRDTAYFISFRHGVDTTAPNAVATNNVSRDTTTEFKGYFPSGGVIDSIKISGLSGKEEDTLSLCGWGCPFIELYFSNGERAASLHGMLVIDSLVTNVYIAGRFNSDLYTIGTGQPYYVRNGEFALFLKE